MTETQNEEKWSQFLSLEAQNIGSQTKKLGYSFIEQQHQTAVSSDLCLANTGALGISRRISHQQRTDWGKKEEENQN